MLATLVDGPFDDKAWVFETKWDGFRLITEKRGDAVRLWSRNGIDVTTKYALLLPALQKIKGSCVIDGELCALDAHGRSRFQLLQNALNKKARLLYVVFDEPRRSRRYFGSLVLAVRDKAKKCWIYVGHVGTGFDQEALKSLYATMQPLRTDKKPLDQKVKYENATTWRCSRRRVRFASRMGHLSNTGVQSVTRVLAHAGRCAASRQPTR